MGSTRWDPAAYSTYATRTSTKTHYDYTATSLKKDFDPKTIKVRESVASTVNPHPTPIIVGLDVTGSMGRVVEAMRKGLGTLFKEIIDRKSASDPHVLGMAIGDMECDRAPVQATQFEADPVTIGTQIEDLYLERGGGGNNHESYLGPLYFATHRTKCDAFKENRKGYLFTVGDEEVQWTLTKDMIERFFGDQPRADLSAEELVALTEKNWYYHHLMVEEGSYMSSSRKSVVNAWTKLIGQRAIPLADHEKMAEVIISIIEVTNGKDKAAIAKSWSGDTSVVVSKAIAGLPDAAGGGTSGPIPL